MQDFMRAHSVILDYDFDTLVGGHINLVQRYFPLPLYLLVSNSKKKEKEKERKKLEEN